ncbi:FtsX-like permease family protein [Microbacterium sp. ZW T2_14]|uniref:FtsX-like permease family protein n=1 Tax=Microbacterium sp. ZW T2_14 TaxID=3378079 RepID=UPI003851F0B4
MTEVLEAPVAASTEPDAAPPRLRAGGWSRWRVAVRLARRQVRRTRLSSLLIVTLVALPIAAMTAYGIYAASSLGTPEDRVRAELGEMQAWVAPAGIAGEGFWQAPTQPQWTGYPADEDGSWAMPEGAVADDPISALPAGTETILLTTASARIETPDGLGLIGAWTGEAWDPRFSGALDLVDGERPADAGEVMVTPATLERLGVQIGGELTLADGAGTFEIVGTLDAATLPDAASAVFLPGTAAMREVIGGERRWYLPATTLSWEDVQALNEDGVVAYSRAVILDPPTVLRHEVRGSVLDEWMNIWPTLLVVAAGGLFAAYVVVMLAGAAFAVAARRQQRSLAVAASVGANRGDLSRMILLQGTTLGALGGVAGLVLGVGAAALVVALTADGSATQYWGFHVPWPGLAAILVFAVVVGTASALVPARTVARTDPLRALRGARRPQKPGVARPVWGSVVLLVGVAMTIACAFVVAAVNVSDLVGDNPLRYLPALGIVVGPILTQVGILMSGSWLLWTTSRVLSRVGLAARIASRDAAANAGRTVPAFAAIAATVFIGVFAVGQSSMQTAQNARTWYYLAPLGSVSISIFPGTGSTAGVVDPEGARTGAAAAVDVAEGAGATGVAVIRRQQPSHWSYGSAAEVPDELSLAIALLPPEHLLDPEVDDSYVSNGQDPDNPLSVVEPDDLETVLGVPLTTDQRAAYRAGAAIVADHRFVADGEISIAAWSGGDLMDGMPSNVWIPASGQRIADPTWEQRVDAIVVDAPLQPTAIAIAPATADRLGIAAVPEQVIASVDGPLSTEERDRLQMQVELASGEDFTLEYSIATGPPSDAAWMIPLLSVVAVLVLGASAVALGLARFERRPDDATLAAVGGTPLLRRNIGFWQGLVIAGFGTIAGAIAGILPPIGFAIQSRGALLVGDIPWQVLGAFCLGLPVAIALANWLVPPRKPDLTRRTAIT